SRKLVRKAAEVDRRESQPEREFTSATLAFVARHTNGGQAERDVVERRLPRQQARLLEHDGLRGETLLDRPLVDVQQAGAQVQQRGLAAARRAHQRDDAACPEFEVDAVEYLVAGERMAHAAYPQPRRAHGPAPAAACGSRQRSTSRLIGSSSRYSTASSRPTTAVIQAIVVAVSRCERDTASAAPTPSCVDSNSAITTTFHDVPSAAIQAGNRYETTCGR